jgi:predicted deacylase
MARETRRLTLPAGRPGTERFVTLHRYGRAGDRPKVYLQAALHADETPALLVAHHLRRLLDGADDAGLIRGEVVLVPYANPIGLDQFVNAEQLGRSELAGGGNFNRNWPDLSSAIAERAQGSLTDDPAANVARIRALAREALAEQEPAGELDGLRLLLAGLALDADIVLDLHCDNDALMHLFLIPELWPEASDLAADLGCRAVLTSEPSSGSPFDEAFAGLWTRLAAHFPDHPIPQACLSGTVELRGQPDVSDHLAETDAWALLRFLQRRAVVEGDPGPLPEPLCQATGLDAVDSIKAPAAGVLSYTRELGEPVAQGDLVAHLIDPAAEDPAKARTEICSGTDGFVLSRRVYKYVTAGLTVAKIVGTRGRLARELIHSVIPAATLPSL